MTTKFRTFDLNTLAGIKGAERLHSRGWKFHSFGLNILTLVKPISDVVKMKRAEPFVR